MIKSVIRWVGYILLLVILGFKGMMWVAMSMVLIHELTHYIAARVLGYGKGRIDYIFIGLVLVIDDLKDVTPKEDIIISLAGPLMNLLLAGVSFVIYKINGSFFMQSLFVSNISLGAFNLVPAFPLDGGRILRASLAWRYNFKLSRKISYMVSMFVGILFMLFYFMMVFSGVKNVSFGLITLFIIYGSYSENRKSAFLIMGDIVRKKIRFIKKKFIEGRTICVHVENSLLEIMGHVDKYRFTTFLVLNDDMQVMDMFYEDELIKGLKDHGNIELKEFLKTL